MGLTRAWRRHGRYQIEQTRSRLPPLSLPPLGLVYLDTPLVNAGHEVEIIDGATLALTNGEIVREAVDWKPDLVGISLYTSRLRVVWALAGALKRALGVPIVLGGPHPTAAPEQTLAEFGEADFLLRGWADGSILSFVRMLDGHLGTSEVPGLCHRDRGQSVVSEPAAAPADLDTIPLPRRELLEEMYDRNLYVNILSSRRRFDTLMTSRNCPYSCGFCFKLGETGFLAHSPERVMAEIREMAARGVDAIEVMDDTFDVDRRRSSAIFDLIEASGLDLELRIRSRVNLVDGPFARRFKQVGGRAISFGMESGSDSVLAAMNKRATASDNARAVAITEGAGLMCQTTWIAGYPGETREDLERSFRLIARSRPTTFNMGVLSPKPGSPVYEQAKRAGTLVGDWSVHGEEEPFVRTETWPERREIADLVHRRTRLMMLSPALAGKIGRIALSGMNLRLLRFGARALLDASSYTDVRSGP